MALINSSFKSSFSCKYPKLNSSSILISRAVSNLARVSAETKALPLSIFDSVLCPILSFSVSYSCVSPFFVRNSLIR